MSMKNVIWTNKIDLFIKNLKSIRWFGQDGVIEQAIFVSSTNFFATKIIYIWVIFGNFSNRMSATNNQCHWIHFIKSYFHNHSVGWWCNKLEKGFYVCSSKKPTKWMLKSLTFWFTWLNTSCRLIIFSVTSIPSIYERPEHHNVKIWSASRIIDNELSVVASPLSPTKANCDS